MTTPDPEWSSIPTSTGNGPGDEELTHMIPKFERRFPGLGGARLSSSYAGLLRRDAGLQPDDLRPRRWTGYGSAPDSPGMATRSPRQSVSSWPI